MRKPTIWVPTRPDTNRAVQSQKMARSLKFQIWEVEGLYFPCSENKGAGQLCSYYTATAQLICAFVFAKAFCWFSYAAAQMSDKETDAI